MYILDIYANDTVSPAFVKANAYLLSKYKDKFILPDEHIQVASEEQFLKLNKILFNELKNLWKKEFNIEVSTDWSVLTFRSKKSKKLFELRFY